MDGRGRGFHVGIAPAAERPECLARGTLVLEVSAADAAGGSDGAAKAMDCSSASGMRVSDKVNLPLCLRIGAMEWPGAFVSGRQRQPRIAMSCPSE